MTIAIPEYVDKYGGPTEKGFEDLEGLLAIRGIHFEKVTPKMKSNQKEKEKTTRTPIYSRLKRIRGAASTSAAMASLPIVRGEDGFAKEVCFGHWIWLIGFLAIFIGLLDPDTKMLKKTSAFCPWLLYFQNISGHPFVINQKGTEKHRSTYKNWQPNMYHADFPILKPTIFRPIVEAPLSMFMAADHTEDGLKLTHWNEKRMPTKIDKEVSFNPIGELKEKFWKNVEGWRWYWLTGVGVKVSIDIFWFFVGLTVDAFLDKLEARGWFTSSWRLDGKRRRQRKRRCLRANAESVRNGKRGKRDLVESTSTSSDTEESELRRTRRRKRRGGGKKTVLRGTVAEPPIKDGTLEEGKEEEG
jgi:hypothetical protein